MRPKKSKKKGFTRVKTDKNSEFCAELKLPFAIEDEVLACWQDGLYYLAVVKTVSYIETCVVTLSSFVIFKYLFCQCSIIANVCLIVYTRGLIWGHLKCKSVLLKS